MIEENGATEAPETLSTESLSVETVEMELSTEDTLYAKDASVDELVDETKSETKDSESIDDKKLNEEVESSEEDESGETKEDTEGETKEVEYKLKLKENSLMDNSMMEDIESFAKENNMSNDMAVGLLSRQEELLENFISMKTEELESQKDGWREEVVKDKSLGGENLNRTIENARRAVTKFGSEEFIGMLKNTGYGDNIEVVRFFSNIGSMMSDDKLVTGKEFGGEKSIEDHFYG